MKHHFLQTISLFLLIAMPFISYGQRYEDRIEKVKYRNYTRGDRALDRDQAEIRYFQQSLRAYERAVARRDDRAIRRMRIELEEDMRREIRQGENKIFRSRRNSNDRYSQPKRRPNGSYGDSWGRSNRTENERRAIVKTQENIYYDFSRTDMKGRGKARSRHRKSIDFLYEFLDSMDAELQTSRRENRKTSSHRSRDTKPRKSRRW